MRKPELCAWMIVLSFFVSASPIRGQAPWYITSKSQSNLSRKIQILTEAIPTLHADTVKFTCYLKIPYRILQFIRQDTLYSAHFDLTVALKDVKNETVTESLVNKNVSTTQYSVTIAENEFENVMVSFLTLPGEYSLFIDLHDLELEKSIQREESLILPNYYLKSFTATEILFYHGRDPGADINESDFPVIPPMRSMQDTTFYARFYVYSPLPEQEITIRKTILDAGANIIASSINLMMAQSRINPVILELNEALPFGNYSMQIELESKEYKTTLQNSFMVQWGVHTTFLPSLDEAIEVLYYIMSRNEWKTMKNLAPAAKKKELEIFWAKRDPDVSTSENELENEYYRRIAFTNEHFSMGSRKKDGWETDRGRIYIIYGQPSHVERPSAITDGPGRYEIWYFENTQKKFYFLDKFGSGDFRLISEE